MTNFETTKDSELGKTVDELISESNKGTAVGQKQAQARSRALLEKISGGGNQTVKGKISATNKITELHKMLLPRYIMKLEEAARLLASYESELSELDNKLQKMSIL